MSNPNCPQIHQQYQNLLKLQADFDQAFVFHDLANSERLMKELRLNLQELEELLGLRFSVEVNYYRPLKEMIEAGEYNWSNDDITDKNFPPEYSRETKKINFELFEISKNTKSEDIEQQMKDQGLRPATLQELLAFGEKYPDKQREFPIVALGSSWINADGTRYVACLYRDDANRELNLYWYDDVWVSVFRFLAVRK